MLSRNQISFIKSLQHKKYRQLHKCFVAEGTRIVEELMQSSFRINQICATKEWILKNKAASEKLNTEITPVTLNELSRISSLKTANQALAVVAIPATIFEFETASRQFVIMLDGISDPGNLGTILRTADWFGINHVLCSSDTVDVYNPKAIQASMGSIARVNVCYLDLKEVLEKLQPDIPVYGSLLKGVPVKDIHFKKNGMIIIGNEAHGIGKALLPYITHPVLIPSVIADGAGTHRPESLNAAVAAAILCWECKKSMV